MVAWFGTYPDDSVDRTVPVSTVISFATDISYVQLFVYYVVLRAWGGGGGGRAHPCGHILGTPSGSGTLHGCRTLQTVMPQISFSLNLTNTSTGVKLYSWQSAQAWLQAGLQAVKFS